MLERGCVSSDVRKPGYMCDRCTYHRDVTYAITSNTSQLKAIPGSVFTLQSQARSLSPRFVNLNVTQLLIG